MQRHNCVTATAPARAASRRMVVPIALALAVAALTLLAYRDLFTRPFAADDYQWLLDVRGLSFAQVMRRAFDVGAQSHFFRPLVWLLLWAQTRAFGLDPRGYHVVSLALHLANAALLGLLAWRRIHVPRHTHAGTVADTEEPPYRSCVDPFVLGPWSCVLPILAMGFVALHPAPFEAVVWVSAQSELLAATLLLAALHLWRIPRTTNDQRPTTTAQPSHDLWSLVCGPWSALATLALGLALLAKESAVIGLPLLLLLGKDRSAENQAPRPGILQRIAPYLLPALVTCAYLALQLSIERRNYLVQQGGYGFGPQLLLNPLRSLALIVAPLPGTEHADAAWLVPVGIGISLVLIGWTLAPVRYSMGQRRHPSPMGDRRSRWRLVLALALTLLPTAPFASPPDSRYLYLPVMVAALLIGLAIDHGRGTIERMPGMNHRRSSSVYRRVLLLCAVLLVLLLAWWSTGELRARERRFAAGAGPGGSLWRLASSICAEGRPDRIIIVDPPLAAPHAEAIVALACGSDVQPRIVGHDQIDSAIKGHTVVVAFPGGTAQIVPRN